MIKVIDYPAGFQVKFTTWENDGDDYKTNIISGLPPTDAKFYYDLAMNFTSRNNPLNGGGLGNNEQSADTLREVLDYEVECNPHISYKLKEKIAVAKDSDSTVYQFFYEFLNWPVQYDYEFCRVVESVEIFYLPGPIFFEYEQPKNVTQEIIK